MLSRFLIFLIVAGCSTSRPTPYQKEKKKEGYRDQTIEEFKVASFKANANTKKEKAQLYAQFRAIEVCRETENKTANIIDIFDRTVEKVITRSTGSGWGPSYYGTYPYYSRYSSFGIGASYNTMSSNSWNETLVYPFIEIYYTCSDTIVRPKLIFKELSAEQVKHLVKDIKGAIQVENIPADSPNKDSVVLGDIILKANGKRIEKVFELIRLFNKQNRDVSVLLLREGEKVTGKLKSADITEEAKKTEEDIIKGVCDMKQKEKEVELKTNKLCL